ncbi:hypothetical protein J6590_071595 [Homalodisca vitripennis]|nr:hypothetical protein J6590_071595 [Homalodisca vitripennis]
MMTSHQQNSKVLSSHWELLDVLVWLKRDHQKISVLQLGTYQLSPTVHGEAEYVNDFPNQPNEVYGAFIVATRGPCDSFTLDASEALSLPGVHALLTAKDIPGTNSFQNDAEPEVIFADKKVPCAGTPLGAIFADTNALAHRAAQLVKVTYQGVQSPQINVKKIVNSKDHSRLWLAVKKEASTVKPDVKHEIQGSHWFPTQYHFTMETQTCYSEPTEDGLNVHASTQCPGVLHDIIAAALKVPINSVNMSVRRCGGGYGSKLGKSGIVTLSCAVSAYVLQRPVRFVMTIEENMEIVGKRAGCLFNYLQIITKQWSAYDMQWARETYLPLFQLNHHPKEKYPNS